MVHAIHTKVDENLVEDVIVLCAQFEVNTSKQQKILVELVAVIHLPNILVTFIH